MTAPHARPPRDLTALPPRTPPRSAAARPTVAPNTYVLRPHGKAREGRRPAWTPSFPPPSRAPPGSRHLLALRSGEPCHGAHRRYTLAARRRLRSPTSTTGAAACRRPETTSALLLPLCYNRPVALLQSTNVDATSSRRRCYNRERRCYKQSAATVARGATTCPQGAATIEECRCYKQPAALALLQAAVGAATCPRRRCYKP
jgi:hypothetical protein